MSGDLDPASPELAAAPFRDGGLGDLMTRAGHAYLEDYVLSLEDGPDHEPTEFERVLLEDFLAGLMNDEAIFGPARRVLHQAAAAKRLFAALKGLVAVRPSNWDDDDDPIQVAAWREADSAMLAANAGPVS